MLPPYQHIDSNLTNKEKFLKLVTKQDDSFIKEFQKRKITAVILNDDEYMHKKVKQILNKKQSNNQKYIM